MIDTEKSLPAGRKEKVAKLIKELAAEFLERESDKSSLITVISSSVSSDLKQATVFITVLPNEREETALAFAKRKRKDLREFLKKKMRIKTIPFVDIRIDYGEKNRQKIDELLREQ